MGRNYYLDVTVQVWEDDEGLFWYSVITEDDEGNDQIIAYGQNESKLGAVVTARDEFMDILND